MPKAILAIDDDEAILAFYQVALSNLGEVRKARNLAEARPQLQDVGVIILDFDLRNEPTLFQDVMRELDGVAPILLCSGVQDARVPMVGTTLGIAGYWNKESGRDALVSLVRATLGK